jgi:hypothetical protein
MGRLYICDVCGKSTSNGNKIQQMSVEFPHAFRHAIPRDRIFIEVCIHCAKNLSQKIQALLPAQTMLGVKND